MSIEHLKKLAAEKAVEQVKSGMVVGLGTGSTARYAVAKIGKLWQLGKLTNIVAIPTSKATAEQARGYGLPLTTLPKHPDIDIAIDGADEVDPNLNVIKGLGGALLREKMVENRVKHFIVVVDGRKMSKKLGLVSPLPVEVTQFGWEIQARWLKTLGCTPTLRGTKATPYITDNGNYIIDCTFSNGIDSLQELAFTLKNRTGVVEHGLFLKMANQVIVAREDEIAVIN